MLLDRQKKTQFLILKVFTICYDKKSDKKKLLY